MEFNPNLVSTPRQDVSQQPVYGTGEATSYISPPVAGSGYPHPGSPQQQMYSSGTPGSVPVQQPVGSFQDAYYHWSSCTPRHDAIYLVVGRILYEFWHRPLVKSAIINGPNSPKVVSDVLYCYN